MKANEYQNLAMRTNDGKCKDRLQTKMDLRNNGINVSEMLNASLGLSGEVGELNDMIKKFIFHGHRMESSEFEKELGDICWYVALMCDAVGMDLNEVLELNIQKLKKRYPDGFSETASINREV